MEEAKAWGPNVILWEMQVGKTVKERWYCVGCYQPPSDKEGTAQRLLSHVIKRQPDVTKLLVLGDLNADLDVPMTTQEDVFFAEMTERGLTCASRHYMSKSTWCVRGRWTFHRPSYTPEGGRR